MLSAALARHLDANDLGVFGRSGTDLFLQGLPDDQPDCVGIFIDAGRRVHDRRRPGLQLVVRTDPAAAGGRARAGYERAEALLQWLDGRTSETWAPGTPDAVRVAWVLADQAAPVSLGDDDNNLPRWSVRFSVELAGPQ